MIARAIRRIIRPWRCGYQCGRWIERFGGPAPGPAHFGYRMVFEPALSKGDER